MQPPFSPTPAALDAIEGTLSAARLARYVAEARGDRQLALRLHVWNARLGEAFYLPIQFAEVAARNAVAGQVAGRFGPEWFDVTAFRALLPPRLADELGRVVADERAAHGVALRADHVVASLTLGFWLNLLTRAYANHVRRHGASALPLLPAHLGAADVWAALERLRQFRNRIAHDATLFDRHPRAELANVLTIAGWISADLRWFLAHNETVTRTLSRRPAG